MPVAFPESSMQIYAQALSLCGIVMQCKSSKQLLTEAILVPAPAEQVAQTAFDRAECAQLPSQSAVHLISCLL